MSKITSILKHPATLMSAAGIGAGVGGYKLGKSVGTNRTSNAMAEAFSEANQEENKQIASYFYDKGLHSKKGATMDKSAAIKSIHDKAFTEEMGKFAEIPGAKKIMNDYADKYKKERKIEGISSLSAGALGASISAFNKFKGKRFGTALLGGAGGLIAGNAVANMINKAKNPSYGPDTSIAKAQVTKHVNMAKSDLNKIKKNIRETNESKELVF